jgi:hypothetical protein
MRRVVTVIIMIVIPSFIEIKGRLNSLNACYHAGLNILFSHLFSEIVIIKLHRAAILGYLFSWVLNLV